MRDAQPIYRIDYRVANELYHYYIIKNLIIYLLTYHDIIYKSGRYYYYSMVIVLRYGSNHIYNYVNYFNLTIIKVKGFAKIQINITGYGTPRNNFLKVSEQLKFI